MGSLDGKVAVVTGAAQGIGRAIAEGLADDRRADRRRGSARRGRGGRRRSPDGVGITADVSNEADVQRLADEAVERCGAIDILVNNAGLYASLEMRPVRADPARRVAPRHGRQRRIDVPHVPRRRAGDARERRRQDREHLVGHAVPRRAVPAALRDVEGRDRRVHARAREGGRQGQRARQLRRAGLHDVGGRGGASRGRREAARRVGRRADDPARPDCRKTSSARSCTSAGPARTSSPGRRS